MKKQRKIYKSELKRFYCGTKFTTIIHIKERFLFTYNFHLISKMIDDYVTRNENSDYFNLNVSQLLTEPRFRSRRGK